MNHIHEALMAAFAVFGLAFSFSSLRSGIYVSRIGDPISRKEDPYKFILFVLITTLGSCLGLWIAIPGLIKGLKGL